VNQWAGKVEHSSLGFSEARKQEKWEEPIPAQREGMSTRYQGMGKGGKRHQASTRRGRGIEALTKT